MTDEKEIPLLRYWRNQHSAGVVVRNDLYVKFERAAYLAGKDVETWFNEVIQRHCEEVLDEHDQPRPVRMAPVQQAAMDTVYLPGDEPTTNEEEQS